LRDVQVPRRARGEVAWIQTRRHLEAAEQKTDGAVLVDRERVGSGVDLIEDERSAARRIPQLHHHLLRSLARKQRGKRKENQARGVVLSKRSENWRKCEK
jgi:hypothetical protein